MSFEELITSKDKYQSISLKPNGDLLWLLYIKYFSQCTFGNTQSHDERAKIFDGL